MLSLKFAQMSRMNPSKHDGFYCPLKSEQLNKYLLPNRCWNVTAIGSNGTLVPACTWDYTGLGLEYHILAGPAFVAMFTVAGLGWGYFADKFNRVKFLTVAALIFSAAISGTSFATKYWHVLLFRMALGVGYESTQIIKVSLMRLGFSWVN